MLFSVRMLIPRLRELGVSDQQIRVTTVDNPKTFFTKAWNGS